MAATLLAMLAPARVCLAAGDMEGFPGDVRMETRIGVLGLRPDERASQIERKCDKMLYEQVALRIALDDIAHQNYTILDISELMSNAIRTMPVYVMSPPSPSLCSMSDVRRPGRAQEKRPNYRENESAN